jgi:hypothetical protein
LTSDILSSIPGRLRCHQMLKVPLILRTLAFAHFGTSVANAVRSQLRVYAPASGATNFPDRLWNQTRTYDTIEFDREFMPIFIWRGIALTVLAAPSALVRKALLFYHSCLARVVTIDSFTHRLQSGLSISPSPLVLWNHRPSDFLSLTAGRRRHGKRKQEGPVASSSSM